MYHWKNFDPGRQGKSVWYLRIMLFLKVSSTWLLERIYTLVFRRRTRHFHWIHLDLLQCALYIYCPFWVLFKCCVCTWFINHTWDFKIFQKNVDTQFPLKWMGTLNPVPSGVTKSFSSCLLKPWAIITLYKKICISVCWILYFTFSPSKMKKRKALLLMIPWQHICLEFGFL